MLSMEGLAVERFMLLRMAQREDSNGCIVPKGLKADIQAFNAGHLCSGSEDGLLMPLHANPANEF